MADRLHSPRLAASLVGAVALQSGRSALERRVVAPAKTFLGSAGDALLRIERPCLGPPFFSALSFRSIRLPSLGPVSRIAVPAAPASPPPVSTIAGWETPMGKSGPTVDHFFPKAGVNWSSRLDPAGLARFLRALHPEKTALNVAAETRLPVDTIKKWLACEALPNGRALLVLACTYGPEVMTAMLRDPPAWLDVNAREAKQARLDAQLARLVERGARVPEVMAEGLACATA